MGPKHNRTIENYRIQYLREKINAYDTYLAPALYNIAEAFDLLNTCTNGQPSSPPNLTELFNDLTQDVKANLVNIFTATYANKKDVLEQVSSISCYYVNIGDSRVEEPKVFVVQTITEAAKEMLDTGILFDPGVTHLLLDRLHLFGAITAQYGDPPELPDITTSNGEKYYAADLIQEMCKQLDNPPVELDENLKRIYDWQKKSLASHLIQAIKMVRAHPIEKLSHGYQTSSPR